MGLNPLSTATAGLQAMRDSIGVVSLNVANAGTAGYVKRTLTTISGGAGNAGVAVGKVTRAVDVAAINQLRLETSGAAYTSTKADVLGQLDKLFGSPGDSTAFDATVNAFTQSLQTLATNPSSTSAQAGTVAAAGTLARQINTVANNIQNLRSDSETRLATQTTDASNVLSTLANLNLKIAATSDDNTKANLLDQRDEALTQLSGYFDVTTQAEADGTLTVRTGSGATLVERGLAAQLSFDGRAPLDAQDAYSTDKRLRSVGTIIATTPGGAKIDLGEPGVLRSGSIAAEFELRDTILPQAQRQMDDLAAGLARALTDQQQTGTALTPGPGYAIGLAGARPGNTTTITVSDGSGGSRNIILVPSAQTPLPQPDASLTADAGATIVPYRIGQESDLTTELAKVGVTATVGAGPSLQLVGSGTTTVQAVSNAITQPASAADVPGNGSQLALFVDKGSKGNTAELFTGSFDGGAQITGFAQRLVVNPLIVATPSALVTTSSNPNTPDAKVPNAVYDALTSAKQVFSSSSGIGGIAAPFSASVVDFAQDIITFQGAASTAANSIDDAQKVALSTTQGRFANKAGVNIDEEMSRLIELQNAYTANARVLSAARDMLDTLLRI